MKIGGLQKLSLIDYPGELAAVIFTKGCNFRCPFCHNPELIFFEGSSDKENSLSSETVMAILKKRRNFIDGVCITGGEPLIQPDITNFIKILKGMGYKIKLDTNGYLPDELSHLINNKLIDFVAMDIKNSFEKYSKTAGVKLQIENIRSSMNLIMDSGMDYEFRTTIVKELHDKKDILEIADMIKGAKKYALQKFEIRDKIFNKELLNATSISRKEALEWRSECMNFVQHCELKGWE